LSEKSESDEEWSSGRLQFGPAPGSDHPPGSEHAPEADYAPAADYAPEADSPSRSSSLSPPEAESPLETRSSDESNFRQLQSEASVETQAPLSPVPSTSVHKRTKSSFIQALRLARFWLRSKINGVRSADQCETDQHPSHQPDLFSGMLYVLYISKKSFI
jgi:hypothetical protein